MRCDGLFCYLSISTPPPNSNSRGVDKSYHHLQHTEIRIPLLQLSIGSRKKTLATSAERGNGLRYLIILLPWYV